MTEEEITILAIKGAIAELPSEQQEACNEVAARLRQMVKDAGSPVGELAFAIVGAELQAA
jgi:hypothetical protein